jgi:hypothetical protein
VTKWVKSTDVYKKIPKLPNLIKYFGENAGYIPWYRHVFALNEIYIENSKSSSSTVHIETNRSGGFSINAKMKEAGIIIVRRPYFPTWNLRESISNKNIQLFPDMQFGLISFALPAGDYRLTLEIKKSNWEYIGNILGLVGLLFVTSLLVFGVPARI